MAGPEKNVQSVMPTTQRNCMTLLSSRAVRWSGQAGRGKACAGPGSGLLGPGGLFPNLLVPEAIGDRGHRSKPSPCHSVVRETIQGGARACSGSRTRPFAGKRKTRAGSSAGGRRRKWASLDSRALLRNGKPRAGRFGFPGDCGRGRRSVDGVARVREEKLLPTSSPTDSGRHHAQPGSEGRFGKPAYSTRASSLPAPTALGCILRGWQEAYVQASCQQAEPARRHF